MKITMLAAGILAIAGLSPASAQSIPSDVRCLLLSNIFSKAAKEEGARQAATQTMIFFAGRLDGRADSRTIAGEMRTQSKTIDQKTASADMAACATRLAKAQTTLQDAAKIVAPAK